MTAPAAFSPDTLEALLAPMRGEKALIGLDVDGTLVDHNGNMAPEVHEALHDVREAGHHVVIATGRSIGATLPIVRLAGVTDGWSVSSNGAVTARITGPTDAGVEVVQTITFDPREALRVMRSAVPEARFAVELADGRFLASSSFDDLDFGLDAAHISFEELASQESVVRVVVTAPDIPTHEFADVVRTAGAQGCEYAIGWSSWMDMSAPGVTKALALEKLRERLGVSPAHTVTIGDGANDIDMLRWAAAGVAMGQAGPDVVAAANTSTLDVASHGAALVLRTLLGGPASEGASPAPRRA